mgnify:CR=1 FL=1
MIDPIHSATSLFRHVATDKAAHYRAIMETFAAAKRQFRLQLRPDEVQIEARWPGATPSLDDIQMALTQLADWGNLEVQPDTARVSSIEDFYRARYLYRLSLGGEAVEAALLTFAQTLARQSELQTVALEDILTDLNALIALAAEPVPDAAKVHTVLRDLVRVFERLADEAQAFMAGVARVIELQQAEVQAVIAFKQRLIDYLQRFVGDLVARSGIIAARIVELDAVIESLLTLAAGRERRDSAPGANEAAALEARLVTWRDEVVGACLLMDPPSGGPQAREAWVPQLAVAQAHGDFQRAQMLGLQLKGERAQRSATRPQPQMTFDRLGLARTGLCRVRPGGGGRVAERLRDAAGDLRGYAARGLERRVVAPRHASRARGLGGQRGFGAFRRDREGFAARARREASAVALVARLPVRAPLLGGEREQGQSRRRGRVGRGLG